jgi:hypothetical protein
VVGCCESGNEPVGSIKSEEFLDELSNDWLLKKDSASRKLLNSLIEHTWCRIVVDTILHLCGKKRNQCIEADVSCVKVV